MLNISMLLRKKKQLAIWSIKTIKLSNNLMDLPDDSLLENPTLKAEDVTDVDAEFVADPFIIMNDSKYYMLFEVLNKKTERGEIGLAISTDGQVWKYDSIVLREKWHLSYPYVFKDKDHIYMIPESSATNGVYLYRAKKFPYEWEKICQLISGNYVDSSVFKYQGKWWMFNGTSGHTLNLFYSNLIEGPWTEHPKSPLIKQNSNISRPAGRVVVNGEKIYRFAQDSFPCYGSLVKSFRITKLSETEYEEENESIIINGSNKEGDWRKDGMHNIDQLEVNEHEWLIVTDGHIFIYQNYYIWKLKRFLRSPVKSFAKLVLRYRLK